MMEVHLALTKLPYGCLVQIQSMYFRNILTEAQGTLVSILDFRLD